MSAASVCHVAWAQVLARLSGAEDVVFGTVLLGGCRGARERSGCWDCSSTRCRCGLQIGEEGVEASVRRMHELLAELLRHEHASLALAQRCSGVPAPTPLFAALLNYRHSPGVSASTCGEKRSRRGKGSRWLYGEERTNYPLTLSVDDLGKGLG